MLLTQAEQDHILAFVRKTFADQLPEARNALCVEDLPLLDKTKSAPFYNLPSPGVGARPYASTGTSGAPKGLWWTDAEDAWYIGDKRARILAHTGPHRRVFISLGLGHGSGTSPGVFETGQVLRMGVGDVEAHLDALDGFQPDVLYVSPSLLVGLIEGMRRRGKTIQGVERVVLNGEVLGGGMVRYFCDALGIGAHDILDTYGSTEAGTIATSCTKCGLYHLMPGLYPEVLAASSLSDAYPSQAWVLVLTSTQRVSFPLVRFVTYDMVSDLEKTFCDGQTHFSFSRIIGRCDDVLNYGELLPSADIVDLIRARDPAADYLIFNYLNHIDIVLEGAPDPAFEAKVYAANKSIQAMIEGHMLAPFRIHYANTLTPLRARYAIPRDGLRLKGFQHLIKEPFEVTP